MAEPDIVIVGGSVVTVDANDSVASGVAVSGGRIVDVGDEARIRALAGRRTRVVELDGGAVLPGINDSHLHFFGVGLNRPPLMLDVAYPKARSIAGIADAVRAAAARVPAGQWIRGTGWDVAFLDECRRDPGRMPTRQDLDVATTDHPVVLEEIYGHSSWLNTAALRAAGIDAGTESPHGSVVEKDAVTGEPTGLLREFGAQSLVHRQLPTVGKRERRQAARSTFALLSSLGITSYTDPGLGPGGDGQLGGAFHSEGIEVYSELAASGELGARVNILLLFGAPESASTAADIEEGLRTYRPPELADEAWTRVAGVKIFADGIPPSRTAWLSQEYSDQPGEYGSLVVGGSDDAARTRELERMIAAVHDAGYQAGIHATGDRASDAVVAAYTAAMNRGGNVDPRHYVIHGDLLSGAAVTAMARHRIGWNPQPAIQWTLGDMLLDVIGPERAGRQHAVRGALDSGVPVAFSSDAPVMFPDWRRGVAAAVLRESKATGSVIGPEHRVEVLEAIRCYTMGGAWQDHAEDWKGSIEVGKVADLCVVDTDPLAVDPHEIPGIGVRQTILDGKVVYEAS